MEQSHAESTQCDGDRFGLSPQTSNAVCGDLWKKHLAGASKVRKPARGSKATSGRRFSFETTLNGGEDYRDVRRAWMPVHLRRSHCPFVRRRHRPIDPADFLLHLLDLCPWTEVYAPLGA